MDKHLVAFDRQAKQVFGPDAMVRGTLGTALAPGRLTITVDDRQLGAGPTFAEAFHQATRRAAELAVGTVAPLARIAG